MSMHFQSGSWSDASLPQRPESVISDVCVDDTAAAATEPVVASATSPNTSQTLATVDDVLSPEAKHRHPPPVHVQYSNCCSYWLAACTLPCKYTSKLLAIIDWLLVTGDWTRVVREAAWSYCAGGAFTTVSIAKLRLQWVLECNSFLFLSFWFYMDAKKTFYLCL